MTEQNKPHEKKEEHNHEHKKKIDAKPLPVDKEKANEIEKNQHQHKDHKHEEKTEHKHEHHEKKEDKKKSEEKPKVKKEDAVARGVSAPISKKHAMYICSFIKGKKIEAAIADLQKVIKLKLAVPYKGEIPHRKGNIERGRYPVNAAKYFITLLKGLKGNVITNGLELEETKIYFGSATWDARPARRGGAKGKRTHVVVKAKEFPMKHNQQKNKENKK